MSSLAGTTGDVPPSSNAVSPSAGVKNHIPDASVTNSETSILQNSGCTGSFKVDSDQSESPPPLPLPIISFNSTVDQSTINCTLMHVHVLYALLCV